MIRTGRFETTEKVKIVVVLRIILRYHRSIKIGKGVLGCFEQQTASKRAFSVYLNRLCYAGQGYDVFSSKIIEALLNGEGRYYRW